MNINNNPVQLKENILMELITAVKCYESTSHNRKWLKKQIKTVSTKLPQLTIVY